MGAPTKRIFLLCFFGQLVGHPRKPRFAVALGSATRKFAFSACGGQAAARAAAIKYHEKVSAVLFHYDIKRGKDWGRANMACLRSLQVIGVIGTGTLFRNAMHG